MYNEKVPDFNFCFLLIVALAATVLSTEVNAKGNKLR